MHIKPIRIKSIALAGMVLAYSTIASADWTNGQAAASVLGQTLFTTGTTNNGGVGAASLAGPTNICVDNTNNKVYVMDLNNHRVLRYSSATAITNQGAAEVVLGQPNFTTISSGRTQSKMNSPMACAISATGTLFVSDQSSRVLRFDNAHLKASGALADGVLGASNFTSIGGVGPTASTFGGSVVFGLALTASGSLFVSDRGANRILRFDNAAAKANGAAADGVLGRANFVTGGGGSTTASTFNTPYGLAVDASNNLYVMENSNRRVLRFNNAPAKANGAAADGVLGAANFTTAGTGAASASNFSNSYSVGIGGDGNLYVGDYGFHRMMIFNSPATKANGASADNVLGQPDFVTSTSSTTATGLSLPLGLGFTTAGYFFVGDFGNNRVMVYANAALSGVVATPAPTNPIPTNPIPKLPGLPSVPGIGTQPTVLDLSAGEGPSMTACLVNTVREIFGADATYLGQTANGTARISQGGRIVSFYPIDASTNSNLGAYIRLGSSNVLNVGTSCGNFNIAPALYSVPEFGATLNGMGLSAQIDSPGVMTITVGDTVFVGRPDYIVTVGNAGASGLVRGLDGLYRFTDSTGNQQIIRAAFLDTQGLAQKLSENIGAGSLTIQTDGTGIFTLVNGQQYVLVADPTLTAASQANAGNTWWQDSADRYAFRSSTLLLAQGFTMRAR